MLSVAGFEGPLDSLPEMARAKKIDLARLPIAELIQCFVGAFEAALARPSGIGPDLGRWGDWLVMAATLTDLRSRLLLPNNAPEARQALNEADALRRQLLARAEMRAATDWLEQRHQVGHDVFMRGQPEMSMTQRSTDITDLLRACFVLLQVRADLTAIYKPRSPPFWQMSGALARIGTLLDGLPDGSRLSAFLPRIDAAAPDRELRCRAAIASTLLAALELAAPGDADGRAGRGGVTYRRLAASLCCPHGDRPRARIPGKAVRRCLPQGDRPGRERLAQSAVLRGNARAAVGRAGAGP